MDFAGLSFTETSNTPSTDMLQSIHDFPTPQDITGACSWFGLIEQITWAYCVKPEMTPYRDLVQSSKPFYWDDAFSTAFTASEQQILNLVTDGVCSFEVGRPTCLATDWSKSGIRFLLPQQYCSCPLATAPTYRHI